MIKEEAEPLFFPVSNVKLIVLSLCTLGLYQYYWFYKNWKIIKKREKFDIPPFWRAVFAVIFCYPLFARITTSSSSLGIETKIKPAILATLWIVLLVSPILPPLVANLPAWFSLMFLLAVFVLTPIQSTVNDINYKSAPEHDLNKRFSPINITVIIIGGILLIMTVIGTFLPVLE